MTHTVSDVSIITTPRRDVGVTTATSALTPSQEATFSELLEIGGVRPVMPLGLVEELTAILAEGTGDALQRWTETSLWLTKSELFSVLRCEASYVADRDAERSVGMASSTAVGIVSHRAIQITHTHPSLYPAEAVSAALEGALEDKKFAEFWHGASIGTQSDLLMQMTSRVTLFLDSWPRMSARWTPRFEESLQAKVGKLTLSARPDLVLGRPTTDGTQRMVLTDLKSGALQDHHFDEGQFYALVATLRFGVAPFRSTVYSLASGNYSAPDVTAETLHAIAHKVVAGVVAMVDVLTERREATRHGGKHCSWCPLKDSCATGQVEISKRR